MDWGGELIGDTKFVAETALLDRELKKNHIRADVFFVSSNTTCGL
jgi:hypothetical protein